MKKKAKSRCIFTKIIARAAILILLTSTVNVNTVNAMELEDNECGFSDKLPDDVICKEQEAVEITELEPNNNFDNSKQPDIKVDISNMQEQQSLTGSNSENDGRTTLEAQTSTTSNTTVIAGSVNDYLSASGDYKIYPLSLQSGIYIQAQLTQPNNAQLDYDLYLLDSDGNILSYSEYTTNINGSKGTLPEAIGYLTSGDATKTYYLYVHSATGGSISESYQLDYSFSVLYDKWESDEYADQSLAFTFGLDGAFTNSRNLSSPIDNDWYVITIPQSRIYNKLQITATTDSANTCSVQVYKNIASNGYQMQMVNPIGNNYSVDTGVYYVRVSNAKIMGEYDDSDIQNYLLSIMPILTANRIIISELNGTEGSSSYVKYSGYGTYLRTGRGKLTITGYAYALDTDTNLAYLAKGTKVTGKYKNPSWESNNTPDYATVTGYAVTDESSQFNITIELPPALGAIYYDTGISYHYFDKCTVEAYISDQINIKNSTYIFHLKNSIYHGY
ncbi:hypothetical protein C8E03_111100 [Lachnotalea glycerini]|uniref:Uncharacterized protein n=1 Tax=Lachnotalea glycerini TaxID=1763509 RepID=A0A318EIP1_9FIRM|nr:hypothetical protein [Lachnotalea glycerini]OYO84469.1 hypothetical protein CG709_14975 [Lachnotalea glycerini]PXV86900.1 hypothetical protein C8E03_111100 [Lachnotalea glycerini]